MSNEMNPAATPVSPPGSGTTLIGCIGFNPASVLIAARHFRPSRAILIATTSTAPQLQVVVKQLGIPARCITLGSANEALGLIADRVLQQLQEEPASRVLFDTTGGNKTLTLGAWIGIGRARLPAEAVTLAYLTPGGTLINPLDGNDNAHRVAIEIPEVLAWNGASIQSAGWSGSITSPPAAMVERKRLGEALVRALARKQLNIQADRNAADVESLPKDIRAHLPPGFTFHHNQLRSEVDGYLQHNGWLEELCLLHATDVLRNAPNTRVALSLKLKRSTGGIDEADVVIVCGARTCIIEAKARQNTKGAGDDLQKRIAKTREFFGDHASVIFVHPAWNRCPPPRLLGSSVRNVHLVGSDLQALDSAIADALGRA